jgi:Family of unknown function (DUF5990)
VRIQIVGTELPRPTAVPVALSPDTPTSTSVCKCKNRRDDLLDLHPGDASTAVWTFDYSVSGTDVRGPYIQGPPGGRFNYLNWGALR